MQVSEGGRRVLREALVTAAVARRLVEELGYVDSEDLNVSYWRLLWQLL